MTLEPNPQSEFEQLVKDAVRLVKATCRNIVNIPKISDPKKQAAHSKKRDRLIEALNRTCDKIEEYERERLTGF
jgi:hypothetical protein